MSAVFWLVAACGDTAPPPPVVGASVDISENESGGLFDTAEDAMRRRERALATELRHSIEILTGVVRARVHLTLPSSSILTKRGPEKSGAAVLVVRDNPTQPTREEILRFVRAARPELNPSSIAVFLTTEIPAKPSTVFVGPVEVVASSETRARVMFAVLLGLSLIASAGLIVAGVKLRRVRRMK